jgi:ribosomal protein S18 acetylase RimI-like enzyme
MAQADGQNCDPLDIGETIYRSSLGNYSYKNALVVEKQNRVAGMLLSFAMPAGSGREEKSRPDSKNPNVFAPYMYLEEPDSWYICGIAFYPEHRGQGLGTLLMYEVEVLAIKNHYSKLSLVAFENNTRSVHLYKKMGYQIVDHAPIVPHPLIPYTGQALLMLKQIKDKPAI